MLIKVSTANQPSTPAMGAARPDLRCALKPVPLAPVFSASVLGFPFSARSAMPILGGGAWKLTLWSWVYGCPRYVFHVVVVTTFLVVDRRVRYVGRERSACVASAWESRCSVWWFTFWSRFFSSSWSLACAPFSRPQPGVKTGFMPAHISVTFLGFAGWESTVVMRYYWALAELGHCACQIFRPKNRGATREPSVCFSRIEVPIRPIVDCPGDWVSMPA